MNCHRGLRRCWTIRVAQETHGWQSSKAPCSAVSRMWEKKAVHYREKSSMPLYVDYHQRQHDDGSSSPMQHSAAAAALAKRSGQGQLGPASGPVSSSQQRTENGATAEQPQHQLQAPSTAYSVHKRVLPSSLTALSSPAGRKFLMEAIAKDTAESYFCLTEQFVNQSHPAYCGVTTLLMVLNAMNMDPQVRWKGGWRYYGDEDVLLHGCCFDREHIRSVGVTMDQFRILGVCHGVSIDMKHPVVEGQVAKKNDDYSLQDFRTDILQTLCHDNNNRDMNSRGGQILVVSFDRATLGQTGSGHFSPLAAYHASTDQVLLLDVARFKYSPYWVSVSELYESMKPLDEVSQQPRGWFVMKPPSVRKHYGEYNQILMEDRRPAHLVPQAQDDAICPMSKIKVTYCKAVVPPEEKP